MTTRHSRWKVIEPGWIQLKHTPYEITHNEIKKNYTLWFGLPEKQEFASLKAAKKKALKLASKCK